jgi:hypothetical protein
MIIEVWLRRRRYPILIGIALGVALTTTIAITLRTLPRSAVPTESPTTPLPASEFPAIGV